MWELIPFGLYTLSKFRFYIFVNRTTYICSGVIAIAVPNVFSPGCSTFFSVSYTNYRPNFKPLLIWICVYIIWVNSVFNSLNYDQAFRSLQLVRVIILVFCNDVTKIFLLCTCIFVSSLFPFFIRYNVKVVGSFNHR